MVRVIAVLASLAGCGEVVGDGDGVVDDDEAPQVGWTAEIDGYHHGVSGTAVIVDEATLEIRDFHYDGGGLNARIYLLADGEAFHRDFELTENLVGEAWDGDTLVLDIPADASFDAWNLITLWCVPAAVSFGEGRFEAPQ